MLDVGIANITMFFVIISISLIFTITWILKSEARVKACKDEVTKVKNDLETSERERFVLSEKIANLTAGGAGVADAVLVEENDRLRKELAEAKASLEEVYKAISGS